MLIGAAAASVGEELGAVDTPRQRDPCPIARTIGRRQVREGGAPGPANREAMAQFAQYRTRGPD